MARRGYWFALVLIAIAALVPFRRTGLAAGNGTRLLRTPTISKDAIAFAYANNIWSVDRAGGIARRLTTFQGLTSNPHFSPDGKWIVIISYGLEIAASDHPYYKHCYLRVMPADGSAPPKVIAYVYGGQGTINVPSWSPDGTHVAFVSNSDVL